MIERHLRNVVIVIGHSDHQTGALAEELRDLLQFAVHGNSLYEWGLAHESALMYLHCVSTGVFCIFKYQPQRRSTSGSFSR